MEYSGLINNYIKGNNQKMIKNNSMHNFMNNSFKYNNNTNIIQKTKSLKRFNSDAYKMKKNTNNSLYNTDSQPIKIKANIENNFIFDNQNALNQQNSQEQDNRLNNIIQEYNYFKYLYNYPQQNNEGKNKFKFKLSLKRPTTAPQKNKNKKEIIRRQNISLNNSNKMINDNENEEKIINFYLNNNKNQSIQTQIAKKQRQIINDINIFDKFFKQSYNRPPSPIVKPGIRLNN